MDIFGRAEAAPVAPNATEPFRTIYVHFENKENVELFSFVIDQVIQPSTRDIWYPESAATSNICLPEHSHKFDNAANQEGLFGEEKPWWWEAWQGMPEFISEDLTPFRTIYVHFLKQEDVDAFSAAVGQEFTELTHWIWYPETECQKVSDKRWVGSGRAVTPNYPIYIISKGRWERRWTSRALEDMCVPYKIVVEPQEYENYADVIDPKKILTLPFSNLGLGSIPARNWVWEHSVLVGAKRHWILDDNIDGFVRWNKNRKVKVGRDGGAIFKAAEDFVERYENIAIAGFDYDFFVKGRIKNPPFLWNRRIYSCILIKNDLDLRMPVVGSTPACTDPHWRGRYNEDTDLSLRALKSGWCTVLFYAFLQGKLATMTCAGGNMEELYKGVVADHSIKDPNDGRLKMAESLQAQHPDVTTVEWKFGRWQHSVNYERFKKNVAKRKKDAIIPQGFNNYGLELLQSAEFEK
jgi:hypothetical protein